jgi:hypothetical protein
MLEINIFFAHNQNLPAILHLRESILKISTVVYKLEPLPYPPFATISALSLRAFFYEGTAKTVAGSRHACNLGPDATKKNTFYV